MSQQQLALMAAAKWPAVTEEHFHLQQQKCFESLCFCYKWNGNPLQPPKSCNVYSHMLHLPMIRFAAPTHKPVTVTMIVLKAV